MEKEINEELKELNLWERIKILEYITEVKSDIPEELAVITANVLCYKIEKGSLPTELDPDKWHLPK